MSAVIVFITSLVAFALGWQMRRWMPSRKQNPRKTSLNKAIMAYQDVHWGAPDTMPDSMVDVADPSERNFPVLGELVEIVYATDKGEGKIEYEHKFRRPRPLLMFSAKNKRLLIGGGGYTVTDRGVVG